MIYSLRLTQTYQILQMVRVQVVGGEYWILLFHLVCTLTVLQSPTPKISPTSGPPSSLSLDTIVCWCTPINPTINQDGSIYDEGNQRWKCSLELCTVLHSRCKLCKDWIKHHNNDTMLFEQAKVSFHTGHDEALVLKQVDLEWEMSTACQETEVLQHELEEVQAEIEWVKQDQQTIKDTEKQLQLQVVRGACHSGSSPLKLSSSWPCKCLCQTHTSSQCCPMTPPFAVEQGPIHVVSRSKQKPIYIGSKSKGGDDVWCMMFPQLPSPGILLSFQSEYDSYLWPQCALPMDPLPLHSLVSTQM